MCMLAIQRLRLLENLLAALSGAAVVHGPSAWRRCICAKLYYYECCEQLPLRLHAAAAGLRVQSRGDLRRGVSHAHCN